MNKLVTYFIKPYDRTIETVVKADDQEHIYDEVSEYVVTNDIANKIGNFFEAYKDTSSTNGVWISGFFGSGKSHLLKILSYVLENKSYNNESLGQLFASKIENDPKLKADITLCMNKYKSESILFNIDQQAQITSKDDQNALLQVFYKVFYDHQGFYGFYPHIAEFEAYLAKEGKYEKFKLEFETLFGKTWIEARKDYVDPRIGDAIAQALGVIYGVDAEKYDDYLNTWEDKQRFSIEDFAQKVSEYIHTKGKNFRLNFFVDEVGQYIAENTKLMLNLQTIAESLDTKCHGNSWVFVTSQEDLESLVGDDRHIQKDDFSKIQGRFSNRIALTSTNVDEVIEKRLLDKNEQGKELFGKLFKMEDANLKTLLTFSDGITFKHYQDQDDFINKYPFVPYQFDLFQQCIKSLSRHNAFQGKHQSVGERSMLGVFQEVLKGINNFEAGDLVSFDSMFNGIQGTLRTETQNSILLAGSQLEYRNPLAVKILKVLFLVKYFDAFKPTTHNIQILLTNSAHVKINQFNKQVEEALNLLEEESYIERRGEVYEYLTNEEKDIEESIKDQRIDDAETSKYLSQVFFDGIIKDAKIRYNENKQEFEYSRYIDGDKVSGRDYELKICFITSDFHEYEHESYFTSQTIADQTMMIVRLPEDKRFMNEVRMFIKTDKYCRKNSSGSNSESITRIIREKGTLNSLRNTQIAKKANDLVSRAQIFINGEENLRSSSSDARTRIIETFQDLIEVVYTKLSLLGRDSLDETELKAILADRSQLAMFDSDDSISPATQEVLNYITRRKNQNERTSLTDIRNFFNLKPYGWKMISSFCILALLYKKGRIEAKQSANTLEDQEFAHALQNNQAWSNVLLEPQQDIDLRLLRDIKEFHKELFDNTNTATDAKEIAKQFKLKANELNLKLQTLLDRADQYPFLGQLKPMREKLISMMGLDYVKLIESVRIYEDDILDLKESCLDPILSFMHSEQRKIFDEARILADLQNNPNLKAINKGDKIDQLISICHSKDPYARNQMLTAKLIMDELQLEITQQQEAERSITAQQINEIVGQLKEQVHYSKLTPEQQDKVIKPLLDALRDVENERFIDSIKIIRNGLDDLKIKQLNLMLSFVPQPKPSASGEEGEINAPNVEPKLAPKQPQKSFVSLASLLPHVAVDRTNLESSESVEEYITALRNTLLDELKKNRIISCK